MTTAASFVQETPADEEAVEYLKSINNVLREVAHGQRLKRKARLAEQRAARLQPKQDRQRAQGEAIRGPFCRPSRKKVRLEPRRDAARGPEASEGPPARRRAREVPRRPRELARAVLERRARARMSDLLLLGCLIFRAIGLVEGRGAAASRDIRAAYDVLEEAAHREEPDPFRSRLPLPFVAPVEEGGGA